MGLPTSELSPSSSYNSMWSDLVWGGGVGKPLSGVGGRVPSLVLLLADLRGNKKGSERLAGVCLCLPTPSPTLLTQVLLGIK